MGVRKLGEPLACLPTCPAAAQRGSALWCKASVHARERPEPVTLHLLLGLGPNPVVSLLVMTLDKFLSSPNSFYWPVKWDQFLSTSQGLCERDTRYRRR